MKKMLLAAVAFVFLIPGPMTGEDAVNSAAAIDAVVRSAATRAEVILA